jgi:UDP-3-O-[3-hydroxymyristoyl] glucosamine N-acyltransferase
MRFDRPVPLVEIARLIGARIIGETEGVASGINEIHKVEEGDLAFVDHPKYYRKCIDSAATYIIINQETSFPPHKALLLVDEPFEAYLRIVEFFRPFEPSQQPVSISSVVGSTSVIMPGAYIGNNVRIGEHCVLYPNVVIMDHCIIGDHVMIQAGTVVAVMLFITTAKRTARCNTKKCLVADG